MGDYTALVIIGVVVVVLVVIAVVLSAVRRGEEALDGLEGKEAGERRLRKREADLAELDQQGRMLYQLIEWQQRAYEEQVAQGRMLGRIASWVTLFGILWLLGLIAGCFLVLVGEIPLLP